MDEVWKDIKGYEGLYQVSNTGKVMRNNRLLTPYFGTDKYRVKYATRIRGLYYYHSILYNASGTEVIDGTLGEALSHGCIRLETYNAEWIYDNVPDETTVFIH